MYKYKIECQLVIHSSVHCLKQWWHFCPNVFSVAGIRVEISSILSKMSTPVRVCHFTSDVISWLTKSFSFSKYLYNYYLQSSCTWSIWCYFLLSVEILNGCTQILQGLVKIKSDSFMTESKISKAYSQLLLGIQIVLF